MKWFLLVLMCGGCLATTSDLRRVDSRQRACLKAYDEYEEVLVLCRDGIEHGCRAAFAYEWACF